MLDDWWFPLDTIRAIPPGLESEDRDDPDSGEYPYPDHRPDVTHFDPRDQPDPDLDDPQWGDTRTEAPETVPPLSPAELEALPDPTPDDRWSRDLSPESVLVTIAIPAPISGGALADDQVMDDDPMAFPCAASRLDPAADPGPAQPRGARQHPSVALGRLSPTNPSLGPVVLVEPRGLSFPLPITRSHRGSRESLRADLEASPEDHAGNGRR